MSSLSTSTAQRIRVLVVGLGTMGTSHARAYRAIEEFELVGLCTSRAADRHDLEAEFPGLPRFERFDEALATLRPNAVAICTYTEQDRKSTRLNSSHLGISYAVFCLKKKITPAHSILVFLSCV